jgi:multidrug resistance protein, MATE family
MSVDLTRKKALRELLIFSVPIIIGQLGLMLVGTGDMIIAGQYSRNCLAAIGLAISIQNPIMVGGLGLQFAISPLLAQRRGRGEEMGQFFWTTLLYSLFVATAVFLLNIAAIRLVRVFDYGPELNHLIEQYLWITAPSMFGVCLYQGLKEFLQSMEKTISANIIALLSAVVNLFFNYSFAFGKYGMPNLQEAGLAWASLSVRTLTAVSLFIVAHTLWKTSKKIRWDFIQETFKVGAPISFSVFLEVMAFCSVTLFVGKFSTDQTAANNLALNIGSVAFMIPLSIAQAVGVKVGHAYGERKLSSIILYAQMALFTAAAFTTFNGILFYSFPNAVMGFYTHDPAVLAWGKTLLFWVACFQIFDGAQVTLAGVLRGLSVTRAPTVAMFIGYWVIGIPLGYYLGFHAGLEAQGFWIGLAISLALVAMMLGFILKHKIKALQKQGL